MGTYFHGNSEIQENNNNGNGLQTLILMNYPAAYVGYSETQPPQTTNNFAFHSSNSTGNHLNNPHAPPSHQPQQHFVGIPLHNTPSTTQVQDASAFHGFLPHVNYNPQMEITAARELNRSQQGLSLTLSSSSQQNQGHGSYRNVAPSPRLDKIRVSGGSLASASGVSNGGVQSVLLSSKYFKVAQELLDEVVNVGKGDEGGVSRRQPKTMAESSTATAGTGGDSGEGSEKRAAELTTAERQEIQMKKSKLVNMLVEVEERYRQYHHQMQIVISWFEQATGIGSAKTYTNLALETISKRFRCLKEAILGQIRVASKSLGEDENLGKIEGSRLKYVDNQIRQQRALQQLGMIQHNAWRPQRGLPERSVSVLRAWLFEHFLHPYPKDSDKIMLAKQTGLTRGQVSNWFINARVRLWKPMVEEMYMEEIKEHERNGSEDKTDQNQDSSTKSTSPQATENQNNSSIPKQHNPINQNIPTSSSSPTTGTNPCFNLIESSEIEKNTHQSPKTPRNAEFSHSYMNSNSTNAENDHMLKFGTPTNFIGGFGSYPIGELGRFSAEQFQAPYSGNGVSLTLGLPHCENISMSGEHQTFMPNQFNEPNDHFNVMNNETSNHLDNVYESMSIDQNRKRFAAQLLPDYVA